MTTVNKKRIRISSPGSDVVILLRFCLFLEGKKLLILDIPIHKSSKFFIFLVNFDAFKRLINRRFGNCTQDDKVQGNPKSHETGQNGEKRRKSKTCYVCDGKDNWVLVCHGEECLISMHQSCTSEEPDFDEFGNFYCPYCWYKRVVVKSLKLREKLLVIDKSRKSRETLGGVGLGLMMDEVSENIENVVEVNVSEGRRVNIVNPRGNMRERDARMREVQSQEALEAGDDVDEGRQKRGKFSEKNEERKKQRRCDINHETAQMHSFVACVNTRKQRRCSEKSQQNERLARSHEKDVFINGEGADSDLGEGTSGQGCCHENNQQQKASFTQSCEQEGRMTDKRVTHGSELREGRYEHGKYISEDGKRKQKGAVVRDKDEIDLASDMRNDGATFNEQENGFRKDEQIEHNCGSSISSPISTDNVNDSNVASQELALIINPGVQERPIEAQPFRSAPPNNPYGHKSYLEKNGTASHDPRQRRFVLCSDRKRKRQFWTQAEEEMLRVGVQKFPGFRNIPWRKILEFGRDVFHEERVPSDLKDKWKKINKMSSFEAKKWVSLSTERQPNHLVSE